MEKGDNKQVIVITSIDMHIGTYHKIFCEINMYDTN